MNMNNKKEGRNFKERENYIKDQTNLHHTIMIEENENILNVSSIGLRNQESESIVPILVLCNLGTLTSG